MLPESVVFIIVVRQVAGNCWYYNMGMASCRKVLLLKLWYGKLPESAFFIKVVVREVA